MNLVSSERLIFKRRTNVDGATQDRAALMVNVRADGAEAIRRKDFCTQARIASRI
jgi:hypothetical protein